MSSVAQASTNGRWAYEPAKEATCETHAAFVKRRRLLGTVLYAGLAMFAVVQGYWLTESRREAEVAARRSDFLKSLMDNAEAGVIAMRPDTGEIVEWSGGAEALLGWKRADAVGKNINLILPEDVRVTHAGYVRDLATLQSQAITLDCWAISSAKEMVPVRVRVIATKTEPVYCRIDMVRSDRIVDLGRVEPPTEDPKSMRTFSDVQNVVK